MALLMTDIPVMYDIFFSQSHLTFWSGTYGEGVPLLREQAPPLGQMRGIVGAEEERERLAINAARKWREDAE